MAIERPSAALKCESNSTMSLVVNCYIFSEREDMTHQYARFSSSSSGVDVLVRILSRWAPMSWLSRMPKPTSVQHARAPDVRSRNWTASYIALLVRWAAARREGTRTQ